MANDKVKALWWDLPQASTYANITSKVTGVPHVVVDHGIAGLSICSQMHAKEQHYRVVSHN
jgi:hypothetical protein